MNIHRRISRHRIKLERIREALTSDPKVSQDDPYDDDAGIGCGFIVLLVVLYTFVCASPVMYRFDPEDSPVEPRDTALYFDYENSRTH